MNAHSTYTTRPSLQALFDRTLAQVREQPQPAPAAPLPVEASRPGAQALRPQLQPEAPSRPAQCPTARPTEAAPARVILRRPGPTPAACPTPAPLETVAPLDELKDGPRRLLELVHAVALKVLPTRGYTAVPSQLAMHLSGEMLARALGVHRVTLWRWRDDLAERGLLDARAHKGTVTHRGEDVTRNTGTLFAVVLKAGHRARLRFDDLKHKWRDLEADRKAGKTAFQTLQQSYTAQGGEWVEKLTAWAVTPGTSLDHPLENTDCCMAPKTVQGVVYALPAVVDAHPSKRAELVGALGQALARALGDEHSTRWYCGLIWKAWREGCEGRAGVQGLAGQLARLNTDRREWQALERPGALLAWRVRKEVLA